jgi:hypothetical protein
MEFKFTGTFVGRFLKAETPICVTNPVFLAMLTRETRNAAVCFLEEKFAFWHSWLRSVTVVSV